MALVMKARRAGGLHSLTSVMALGMAAPSPTPVMKRSAVSVVRSGEKAEARQAAPNTTTEPMSARRRLQRSANLHLTLVQRILMMKKTAMKSLQIRIIFL